jgi:hypothetical protein
MLHVQSRWKGRAMRKRLLGLIAAAVLLSGLNAMPALADPPASTGHSLTSTVSCSGGTGYTVDANAYEGQVVAQTMWNSVNKFGSVCKVSEPAP